MDFGGDFLKFIAVDAGPCCGATNGTFGLTAGWTTGRIGVADGAGKSVFVGGFVQHFFHTRKLSKMMSTKSPNIVAGEEKIQCLDCNGSFNLSKFCNNSLASKEPVVVSLIWWTALAICSASLWSKNCNKDRVQSSQVEWTCISSVSSAVIKWSMVGMLQPDCTVTAWPELIVNGEDVLGLGHTCFVAIVPTEYTNHVLLPRLKIFSLLSEIRNLQLALISVELARNSEPMQSWIMLVLRTVLS